jgi:hypothetical protein
MNEPVSKETLPCNHGPDMMTCPKCARTSKPTHYVLATGAAVYVKEAEFFKSQGGHTESWGRRWLPVVAESVEDARRQHAPPASNPLDVLDFLRAFIAGGRNQDFRPWARELYAKLRATDETPARQKIYGFREGNAGQIPGTLPGEHDETAACWACKGLGVIRADGIAINCPECNAVKSAARQSETQNGGSPAGTHEHLYRYTSPRVCIYCGIADVASERRKYRADEFKDDGQGY